MRYNIDYLDSAKSDLLEITTYISEILYSPASARKQIKNITDAVKRAAENPYMYPLHYPAEKLQHDYRKIPVGRYLVFYWVDEVRKSVTVARILYSRQNYMTSTGSGYLSEPPMRWKLK